MCWKMANSNKHQTKDESKEQRSNFIDSELEQIPDKKDQLISLIQKQYGVTKEETEKQIKQWEARQ